MTEESPGNYSDFSNSNYYHCKGQTIERPQAQITRNSITIAYNVRKQPCIRPKPYTAVVSWPTPSR